MNAPQRRVGRYDLVTPMLPCKDEIVAKFEKLLLSGAVAVQVGTAQMRDPFAAARLAGELAAGSRDAQRSSS